MTRSEPSSCQKFHRELLYISFYTHLLPHHFYLDHALSTSPVIVLQCALDTSFSNIIETLKFRTNL